MKRWAVIRNGIVENIIVWDGVATWQPPEGTAARELGRTESVDIGWILVGDHFEPPSEQRAQD